MLNSLQPSRYNLALIQEPNINFRGVSRTNYHFTLVYPTTHSLDPKATQSLILVRTSIPSAKWTKIKIHSPDITAIELQTDQRTIRIMNIYNDCRHNKSLEAIAAYIADPQNQPTSDRQLSYIWARDFNRHHPIWDKEWNHHLFTNRNQQLALKLLQMLSRHKMAMTLLKDIPTLKAHATGNYTCTDNVFCSEDMAENFITCGTAPTLHPTKTDHIPILFSFHLDVGNRTFKTELESDGLAGIQENARGRTRTTPAERFLESHSKCKEDPLGQMAQQADRGRHMEHTKARRRAPHGRWQSAYSQWLLQNDT
ncbi:unnamed protein product [Mycena citricolor]|uniref:Endonuclease/exonuclease/phosphatase domain-containing protein n=1 Tax=Mycena citricolor TaxID=2018698 RepID=A0AAD2K3Q7_9AGAR|nr:unnamed protein product [Mycena citricolor]